MKTFVIRISMSQQLIHLLLVLIFLSACDKNPIEPIDPVIPPKSKAALWVGSEGLFQHGDASLMYVDIHGNKIYPDVFKSVNNRALGDVLQSINIWKDKVYLVVNNSQKIEIIDRNTFASTGTITGFSSPRYIEFQHDEKAYVSEFYTNSLKIVNPKTQIISGSIDCGGWQEEIRLFENKLYVTVYSKNKVLIIDTQTDQVIDSIVVGTQPISINFDALNRLWVGCDNGDNNVQIYRINTVNFQVEQSIQLPSKTFRKLTLSTNRQTLYVLCDYLYRMNMQDTLDLLPGSQFLTIGGSANSLYSLAIDPQNDDIYLADVHDFQQASDIVRYSKFGGYQGQFKSGINAGSFYFDYGQ